jgi:predicted MFS family arabinose efflux permease
MVVFPLGPQESRLWRPGVPGVAALAAAFPLAAALAGLLARRAPSLPATPRALAALALLATLPCALSFDYPSLVAARVLAGLATGVSYVAIHRVLPASSAPLVGRLTPRVIAFGMPACLLAATVLDWRFAFVPILVGQAFLVARTSQPRPHLVSQLPAPRSLLRESAPLALVATAALACVSAAYLTILSGYLVFNAGHTELHIPVVLLLGALLSLAVPPALRRLRARLAPPAVYATALAASALSLVALLALRSPLAAPLAVGALSCFLAVNAARHLALAQLVLPGLPPASLPAHQTHTHLAHHLGSGLGALAAGTLITITPARTLTGMPALLIAALLATSLALTAGLAAARHPSRSRG